MSAFTCARVLSDVDSGFGEEQLGMFTFLRLYVVFRVLRDHSPLWTKRARIDGDLTTWGINPPKFDWRVAADTFFH